MWYVRRYQVLWGKQGGGLVNQREYCITRKVACEQGSEGDEGLSQAFMREAHSGQREQ